tara:strand:- start:27692 stop:28207 length:516 start_codon:yes stop_codon:yes gene_type:complete
MARRGRKPKLTPERQDQITTLIRGGNYKRTAAQQAGIDERTFYAWFERGEPGHKSYTRKYAQFRQAVEGAEAESEIILVDAIIKDGTPANKLEVLARRFPERWGRKQQLEHTGKDGAPIDIDGTGVSPVTIVIANPDDTWKDSDDPGEAAAETDEADPDAVPMPGDTRLDD